jgi:DNA replication licensing factor MCM4
MRKAIKTSAMDPRTRKIDMALLTTGTLSGTRKLHDIRKAIVQLIDDSDVGKNARSNWGVRYMDLVRAFGEQSSIKVDLVELAEVLRELEREELLELSVGLGRRVC